jgi:hypothetical protein
VSIISESLETIGDWKIWKDLQPVEKRSRIHEKQHRSTETETRMRLIDRLDMLPGCSLYQRPLYPRTGEQLSLGRNWATMPWVIRS